MSGLRDRISASAVDFALNAFWVAVWGAGVTAALFVISAWQGLPERWLWAVSASFLTFMLVLMSTAAIVWFAHRRSPTIKPVGRKGLLDFIRDRDRGLAAFNKNINALTKHSEQLAAKANRHARLMDSAKRLGWQWLIYHRLGQTARSLRKQGQKMSIYARRLSESTDLFIENTDNWLQWMHRAGSPVRNDSFTKSIESLRAATIGALPNVRGLREASEQNRHLSSAMDLAGAQIVGALDQVIASMERTIAFFA